MTGPIPFEPLREAWGEYELPNGIVARLRNTVVRIESITPEGTPRIKFKLEFLADVPPKLKKEPTGALPPREKWKNLATIAAPKPRRIPYSLYEVKELGLLLVRCRVREIKIHDVVNRDGEPILSVDSDSEILGVGLEAQLPSSPNLSQSGERVV